MPKPSEFGVTVRSAKEYFQGELSLLVVETNKKACIIETDLRIHRPVSGAFFIQFLSDFRQLFNLTSPYLKKEDLERIEHFLYGTEEIFFIDDQRELRLDPKKMLACTSMFRDYLTNNLYNLGIIDLGREITPKSQSFLRGLSE